MGIEKYFVKKTARKYANICADCQHNINDCPWLHDGKLVPGWRAKQVRRYNKSTEKWERVWSVRKGDCPLYIPPPPWRKEEQDGTEK